MPKWGKTCSVSTIQMAMKELRRILISSLLLLSDRKCGSSDATDYYEEQAVENGRAGRLGMGSGSPPGLSEGLVGGGNVVLVYPLLWMDS
jgi:hypothetical protein